MPEVFKSLGYSFFFYSKEHEPIHIHIEGNGGYAKFGWNGVNFDLVEVRGIKASDLRKIAEVIEENKLLIIRRWNEHFNG